MVGTGRRGGGCLVREQVELMYSKNPYNNRLKRRVLSKGVDRSWYSIAENLVRTGRRG